MHERDNMNGWTGKRRVVDLTLQRSWIEKIPEVDLMGFIGGRGLNGKYFLDRAEASWTPSSPDNPVALATGPLAGTFAPCSGWTILSTVSPVPIPPRVSHTSLPGHAGSQLKLAGLDQLVIRGKAERPLILFLEGENVVFEEGKHLWGKDTVQTTVAIQEEKKDRNIEVLCIGPAGENLVSFANLTHRFSWSGDHIGLGYVFGSKNLKAIALGGENPVAPQGPDRFLQACLALRERIRKDPAAMRLGEEGSFGFLQQLEEGIGIKNFTDSARPGLLKTWGMAYFSRHFYGKEACSSCPIHCGRITEVNGNYFGGVHFESAWSLGPNIGIESWEKTLRLYRVCQLQGLDPSSTGSLLAWLMDCSEKGILTSQDLGSISLRWGDEKEALRVIHWIVEGNESGKLLRPGGPRTAQALGKGMDQVPHFWGMDLPSRDPRSSVEYALSRALFPTEWDFLLSLSLSPSSPENPQKDQPKDPLAGALALEKLRQLADMNGLCPLVVARLPLVSMADVRELLTATTGREFEDRSIIDAITRTLEAEKELWKRFEPEEPDLDPFPSRFFNSPGEKRRLLNELANYRRLRDWGIRSEEETRP